jgi:hypothetical protein
MVGTKDGFNFLDVQQRTAAVNQGLKNLIHLPAGAENKVAAVFDLIVGILVMKPAAFLLFQLKGETPCNRSCRSTVRHIDRSMTQACWELSIFSGVTPNAYLSLEV